MFQNRVGAPKSTPKNEAYSRYSGSLVRLTGSTVWVPTARYAT